jgi:hypothetical protein
LSGHHFNRLTLREEARNEAQGLMLLMSKRLDIAVKNSEMFADLADELKGMAKNIVYLIEIARMSDAGADGGGEREADRQPAALRLVGGR